MDSGKEYERWMRNPNLESGVVKELRAMDNVTIEDAFYRNLSFGTGGLRGVIGAGTNRMNVYTVAKAAQGLSDYLLNTTKRPIAVIGYDSRIKSEEFAKVTAELFAANGIAVYIWPQLMPVPTVSFAVRHLHASAGVMITASHNPSQYNGFKVYGPDGCQITLEVADAVFSAIEKVDIFQDVKRESFETGLAAGKIAYISEDVYTAYVEAVKSQSHLFGDETDKNISIVYSPLNGSGLKPVMRVLRESGYTHIFVVPEQEQPDGHFPTCPFPNPEVPEAMAMGIEYAKKEQADLLLATDPDCDRMGIAVKNVDGEYVLLSGNETGILLLDYICSQRVKHKKMPQDAVMITTIVTTDLAERIAAHYGVRTIHVLTGFKFIGEQIGMLEEQGKKDSFIFGFEESYGYLSGDYVRDKDAVNGALLVCEMFCFYASKGIGLTEKLKELYEKFGYCLNTMHSYEFKGAAGAEKMEKIMQRLRGGLDTIGESKIIAAQDYLQGVDHLPPSDVVRFLLEDGSSIVIRPSGTEPKIKIYMAVFAETKKKAKNMEGRTLNDLTFVFSEEV